MDVVVFNNIAIRIAVDVAPRPADADAGVIEIVDVVVNDLISAALGDQDANGLPPAVPTIGNLVVRDDVAPRFADEVVIWPGAGVGFAEIRRIGMPHLYPA